MSRYIYHYTKADTALTYILPSGQIRLSPIADTNDPWEARPHDGGVALNGANLNGLSDVLNELNTAMRAARLACFCADDPAAATDNFGRSSHGWARDRMWAQYADNHGGVCLWLDRDRLVRSFNDALSFRGDCIAAEVQYSDDDDLAPVDMDAVCAASDRAEHLLELRRRHAHQRYFRKRLDWASEHEFRLLLLDKAVSRDPAYVPIEHGVLAGVTVGFRFPSDRDPLLGQLCEKLRVPVSRIVYSGTVFLNPHGPPILDSLPRPWF